MKMKTKLETSPEDKLEKLLKNNNFRNNQNYVFSKESIKKIDKYSGFSKYKKLQEVKINKQNYFYNIFYLIIFLYYIYAFFIIIRSDHIIIKLTSIPIITVTFIISNYILFFRKSLNRKYKFYKNKDKVIILRK